MNVCAVVQARMGSTRLPGKTLLDIVGKPMLWHVVKRTSLAKLVNRVIVATSDGASDDPIAVFCQAEHIDFFRGSELDVLDRYYRAAVEAQVDTIVRITSDCPLIDPAVIDEVIGQYQTYRCDYVSNTIYSTYPDGLDVEVFSFQALEQAWKNASQPAEREHVTPYIRNSGKFAVRAVVNKESLFHENHRWTVDEQNDLNFVREVYQSLADADETFLMEDVLRLLRQKPWLRELNGSAIPNEGYYMSIAREQNLMQATPLQLQQTKKYLEQSKSVIPSQSQTFSKAPSQFVQGVSPAALSKGQGSHVWDTDGNEYIDFITALGPVILGYNWGPVSDAAITQIRKGVSFSLPTILEAELAELLVEIIPCAEMVRYGKNGSDVTSAAVRLARAFTGREKIVCCGYHGWHDWFIGTTTRNLGVPKATRELTKVFEYNNIGSLEKLFAENPNEIAAVIMEPVGVIEPQTGFLDRVKEVTHRNGALLIFDEVITGFRVSLGGAQEHYGVTPDLACFGKAVANGFPLSAVVGAGDLMKLFDDIFFSGTFGGEAVSLAAAIATIKEIRDNNVIPHLWEQGRKLRDGYNVLSREKGLSEYTKCIGLPPRTVMTFSPADGMDGLLLRSLLQQELIKRGVLFLVGANTLYAHTNADIDHTLRAYRAALEYIADAINSGSPESFLEGEIVKPVFRRA